MQLINNKNQKQLVRHFAVYKNTKLVLLVEDMQGILLSTALPDTEGPPKHPFINGQAMSAEYENELGEILRHSHSFDEFLSLLINEKYDIFSYDREFLHSILTGGYRIYSSEPVAAVWKRKGQFAELRQQTLPRSIVFDLASVTVYDSAFTDLLFVSLSGSEDFGGFLRSIESAGLRYESMTQNKIAM